MGDMNLSKIRNQITTQIEEIKEELKNGEVKASESRTDNFVKSISQSFNALLELDKKSITPKLNEDMQRLSSEIEKLKKQAKPDVSLLISVLAVFEAVQEDLKVMKDDPDLLKRGNRVEKVETDRFEG